MKKEKVAVYLIITLSVLARLIPHLHNFSPVYGALLFGGAQLKKRDSLWFPLLLLTASDYVLTDLIYGLTMGWLVVFQVAAFASIIMVGWMLREKATLTRLGAACFAAPLAFFVISNFGVWACFTTFPHTAAGLFECYVAGLPYFGRTVVSTVLGAGLLFGLYELWRSRQMQTMHAS
jgi:hypothetical protein